MEYYDPMLYMSTEEHPNTMGITATLTEPYRLCGVRYDGIEGVCL